MIRNVDEILAAVADLQNSEVNPIDRCLVPETYFDHELSPNLIGLVKRNQDAQFDLVVSKKEVLTHDSILLELKFPNRDWTSGIPVGCSCLFYAKVGGKEISRKYTAISPLTEQGKLLFAIKVYQQDPKYPGGGKMS